MPQPHKAFRNLDLSSLQPPPALAVKAGSTRVDSDVVHFLDRTTFGYRESELVQASATGLVGYLDAQLSGLELDDGGLETMLYESLPSLGMSYRELFETRRRSRDQPAQVNPPAELIAATLVRQLYSPRQLYEVMVEFWTNHFNVFLFDGPVQLLKTVDDRDHIRPHALGRFGDLLHASAASPAMLYYLDNYSNTRDGPNENYARELLELHTLGVDGGYNEHDVKEVARCFTGWTINPRHPNVFVFNPLDHDFGEKYVLDTTIPANRGIEDGRQVLDILAGHPSTARFLATKLCRRFIADDPAESAIDRVAETYRASDGDISAMLRTLFLSDEFFGSAGNKFKRPVELTASVIRRLDVEIRGDFLRPLFQQLEALGQVPFLAQPPTGYADRREAWLSTSALLNRWNFGTTVAYGSRTGDARPDRSDRFFSLDLAGLAGDASDAEGLVDQLVGRVLHRPVASADRDALVGLAEANGGGGSSRAARAVLAAILSSPDFQQR